MDFEKSSTQRSRDLVAIVHSGGGAKGAFGLGVLEVMARHDIGPACVSGTSVGGLNAVALANGDLEQAALLWTRLTPYQLMVPQHGPKQEFTIPKVMHLLLSLVIGPPMVLLNLSRDAYSSRGTYLANAGIPTQLLSVIFLLGVCALNMLVLVALFPISVSLSMTLLTITLIHASHFWKKVYVDVSIGLVAFFAFGMLIRFAFDRNQLQDFYGSIAVLASLLFWLYLIPRFCERLNVFSHEALATLVMPFCSNKLQIPTFVCTGELHKVLNFRGPGSQLSEVDDEGPMPSTNFWGLVIERLDKHVPRYIDLSLLGYKEKQQYLCSTAALPLGLFGAFRTPQNEVFEDGGVIDNTPILPVIECCPEIPTIYIIHLEPLTSSMGGVINLSTSAGQKLANNHWRTHLKAVLEARMERQLLVRFASQVGSDAHVPKECDNAHSERDRLVAIANRIKAELQTEIDNCLSRFDQKNVLTIAPNVSLGNFLTGTLNFAPTATARFRNEGQTAAENILKLLPLKVGSNGWD